MVRALKEAKEAVEEVLDGDNLDAVIELTKTIYMAECVGDKIAKPIESFLLGSTWHTGLHSEISDLIESIKTAIWKVSQECSKKKKG